MPNLSVQDGIQAVRLAFKRIWIDESKCEYGIDALSQYQREFNEDTKSFRDKPLHDWTSHGSDAFRYLCIAYKEEFESKQLDKPIRGLSVGMQTVSLNEMWADNKPSKDRI